jgi:hypothetical protein
VELKDLLNQMEKKFRDPESKNKIKQLKNEAHKQIERNKIILKELINKYPIPNTDHSLNAPYWPTTKPNPSRG